MRCYGFKLSSPVFLARACDMRTRYSALSVTLHLKRPASPGDEDAPLLVTQRKIDFVELFALLFVSFFFVVCLFFVLYFFTFLAFFIYQLPLSFFYCFKKRNYLYMH